MAKWKVRAHYPSGDVVEEFDTEDAAESARQRHLAQGVPVALAGPATAGATVPDRCSFCGKDRSRVSRLIAGPTGAAVAICDECVALCSQIIWGSAPSGAVQQ